MAKDKRAPDDGMPESDWLDEIKARRATIPPGEYVESQEFHGAGGWYVHQPGGNRPHKIAYCARQEWAEALAAFPADIDRLIAEVERLRRMADECSNRH